MISKSYRHGTSSGTAYTTLDEQLFIRHLAATNRVALRNYAEIVRDGRRRFDPSVNVEAVRAALDSALDDGPKCTHPMVLREHSVTR